LEQTISLGYGVNPDDESALCSIFSSQLALQQMADTETPNQDFPERQEESQSSSISGFPHNQVLSNGNTTVEPEA